jgi:ubiquinone/menaquinone biosynthesis C-methylase UbiE
LVCVAINGHAEGAMKAPLLQRVKFQFISKVPKGRPGIFILGHREYVGGLWDKIGKLQADFMRQAGLAPHHVLVDIACGSLRGGVHLIPYLEPGNYLGIDEEARLIELGIERELGQELYERKTPEFVVSSSFEFEKFSKRPDFAIAHSLFTNITERDILTCLTKLRAFVKPETRFFATYFVGERTRASGKSHPFHGFTYTREQTESFGQMTGWKPNFIGAWGHPRNQMMVEYRAA